MMTSPVCRPAPWARAIALCSGVVMVFASLLFSADPKRQAGVPEDAVYFEGKWYRVYLDDYSWKNAQAKCLRSGGNLAIVRDQGTHNFLKKLANARKLFIGASSDRAGAWTWVDGSAAKFQAWERGQPNNLKGREHYVAMSAKGTWYDVPENSDWAQGYICEWAAKR